MSFDQTQWFTEALEQEGTAFSLKIKRKLHEEQSAFQHIEIYETERFGNLMVIDGSIMLTQRDNFLYHEMMAHPALFTHANPRRVVIIGGGDCGTLREVLKHDGVRSVVQIDIDERVTRLSEQFFPELCESNNDPRVDLRFEDGIEWIKRAEDESIDVLIIDSTDPVGPAVGLFAEDFYRECCRALADNGIFVQQSEAPLLHTASIIKDIQRDLRAAGFEEIHTVPFPQPVYPSGWWSATLAMKAGNFVAFRREAARSKPFRTDYYNVAIHEATLAIPEFMRRDLE